MSSIVKRYIKLFQSADPEKLRDTQHKNINTSTRKKYMYFELSVNIKILLSVNTYTL